MEFCPDCGSQLIYANDRIRCSYCAYSVCCCADCISVEKVPAPQAGVGQGETYVQP